MIREYEKRPKRGRGWEERPVPSPIWQMQPPPIVASCWQRGPVTVISTLVDAELPGGGGAIGRTWNASITRMKKRPKPGDVHRFRLDFDMMQAEEDNHHPGNAKHFFLVVDPAFRGLCECKTDEVTHVEPDGYTWTNPRENELEGCRGCEASSIHGRPCPVHGRVVQTERPDGRGYTVMGMDPGLAGAGVCVVIDDPIVTGRRELAPAGQAQLDAWLKKAWPGAPVIEEPPLELEP